MTTRPNAVPPGPMQASRGAGAAVVSQLHDQALVESVRTHRSRLAGAMVFGIGGTGRTVRTLTMRLIIGAVVAAIAAAACVGIGFIDVALKTPASGTTAVVSPTASLPPTPARTNPATTANPATSTRASESAQLTPISAPSAVGGSQ